MSLHIALLVDDSGKFYIQDGEGFLELDEDAQRRLGEIIGTV